MSKLAAFQNDGYLSELDRCALQLAAINTYHLFGSIVEVGSWKCLSTSVILSASNPEQEMLCIDPVTTQEVLDANLICVGGSRQRKVRLLNTTFEDPCVVAALPAAVSMAFLDHNHEYQSTLNALTVLWGRIVSGGVLVVHDFQHSDYPGGTQACTEAVGWMRSLESVHLKGGCISFYKSRLI